MQIRQFFATFLAIQCLATNRSNGLTIDNQLVIIANDCYTRIAIGSILAAKDIATSVMAKTVTECEDECSRKRNSCEIFSFGISSKGNATCLLGTRIPNADELLTNTDYDIYIRQQSSPSCMPDRLYKLGSGERNPINYNKNEDKNDENYEITLNGNKSSVNESSKKWKQPSTVTTTQNERPVYGIKETTIGYENIPNYSGYQTSEEYPNFPPGYKNPGIAVFDVDNPNAPYTYANKNPYGTTGYDNNDGNSGSNRVQENTNFYIGYQQNAGNFFYPKRHEYNNDNRNQDDDYFHSIHSYETPERIPCYRKLFTGKRLAEIHIRRAINCENIEDCSRECDLEKGFPCEGFNYRHAGRPRGPSPPPRERNRGICELTSMQPSRIDVIRDTLQEPRYDYYERDSSCRNNRRPNFSRPGPPSFESGWHDLRRPLLYPEREEEQQRYHHNLQRPVEIPRPLGYDYLPNRKFHVEPPQRNWLQSNEHFNSYPRRVPSGINIRPIEDEVRYEYFPHHGERRPHENRRPADIWYRPERHNDYGNNDLEPTSYADLHPGRRKDVLHGMGVYGYNYMNYGHGYDDFRRPQPSPSPPLSSSSSSSSLAPPNSHKRPWDYDDGNDRNVHNYASDYGSGYNNNDYNNGDVNTKLNVFTKRYDECSMRSGAGFKLRRELVVKSYLTPTVDHCEYLCVIEEDCVCSTYSFRYSVGAERLAHNCFLSEISYKDLDLYTDLVPDRDYDIYSINGAKECDKPRPTYDRPLEECFWRVRTGCGVPKEVVRKSIVARGIGECQSACVKSRSFMCRSFVYRYGQVIDDLPNCFLSDWPSQEIDPLSLPELEDAELYQRGSFGRGCEISPFPPLNNNRRRPEPDRGDDRPPKKDEVCYSEYKIPCRLTPEAVTLTIYVNSEYECRESCSKMREKDGLPCMSFSYRLSNDREENHHNCFMSDVPRKDLRPGIDYVHGDGYILFAWREFDPQCDSGYSIGILIDDDNDRDYKRPPPGNYFARPSPPLIGENPSRYPSDNERPDDDRHYDDHRRPELGGMIPYGNHNYGPNLHPVRPNLNNDYNRPEIPANPDRPDPIDPNYGEPMGGGGGGFYDTDSRYGHQGHLGNRYNDYSYKYGGVSTFQHFTVNGRPCKRGTKCERNKVAKFWSCEPEGSEYGSWDYCCEPNHHCGYSLGYNYPWCYVGPYKDQWRPCSEKYYPTEQINRPIKRPSVSSDRYDMSDDSYGEIPRPGLIGRHWPVAYLHGEPPPNTTKDSISSADTRKNRELETESVQASSTIVSKTRADYAIDNSQSESSRSATFKAVNVNEDKIERITVNDDKSSVRFVKNSTDEFNVDDKREIDELLKLRESFNRTDDKKSSSSHLVAKTFIRLPTISTNKSKESTTAAGTFDDYFETVDVN